MENWLKCTCAITWCITILLGANLIGHQLYYRYIGERDEQRIRYCWYLLGLWQIYVFESLNQYRTQKRQSTVKEDILRLEIYRYCEKQKSTRTAWDHE